MLKQPILFVDIDGVLNSTKWMLALSKKKPTKKDIRFSKQFHERYCRISDETSILLDVRSLDPSRISVLNEVLSSTGSSIVVTSTWRCNYSVLGLQKLLEYRGLEGTIVGVTPVTMKDRGRGREIQEWLESHAGVNKFAILDDDRDLQPYMSRLVLVEKRYGLTTEDAQRAIDLLS